MKLKLLLPFLCSGMLLTAPTWLHAETAHDDTDTNLSKELAPPKATSSNSEVRSFTRDEDQALITEYAQHGHVYLIKVQPAGGFPPYYLEDSNGDGTFNKRLPGGYKHLNPPTWVIKKF